LSAAPTPGNFDEYPHTKVAATGQQDNVAVDAAAHHDDYILVDG
jgi:hypothetical protein